jgi:tRNAThr (cytosine32-N3)-methyltransferase
MEASLSHDHGGKRKQLKNGMSHLQNLVTIGEPSTYGVPAEFQPVRKPKTESGANPEKRTDPFQFGSRHLEEGDDIFAYNAWDHVETDDAYKEFADGQFQMQKDSPVSDFDKSTYVYFETFLVFLVLYSSLCQAKTPW